MAASMAVWEFGAMAQPPSTLTVAKDRSAAFTSIQAAIDAAPTNATIKIAPGIYEENLVIEKPLTLAGAGWERTVVIARTTNQPFATALTVRRVEGVQIRGLKFADPTPGSKNAMSAGAVVEFRQAGVEMTDCAVAGGPGYGVAIVQGANVNLHHSLVAAMWGYGVIIAGGKGLPSHAHIFSCDIRNCCGGGIGIGPGKDDARIERCRISGCGFHGIRYDDASPIIVSNVISGHAISGIYASGKSGAVIRHNLFYKNEMDGMSCWPGNHDCIEGNTFVQNLGEAIAVVGSASPAVRRNIFYEHPTAISQSKCGEEFPGANDPSSLTLDMNLFWQNGQNWHSTISDKPWAECTNSLFLDPQFRNPKAEDFSLAENSTARSEGIGADELLPVASFRQLQPEEQGMIPPGESRESRHWRKSIVRTGQTLPSYEETFTQLYRTIGADYPYFRLKNIDWGAIGREMLPRAAKVKTDTEFGLLCLELLARLQDSHAFLNEAGLEVPTVPAPSWSPGFICLMGDSNKPVIYVVIPDSPADKAGLRPGMTVLQVNGKPSERVMDELMNQARKYCGFSSDRFLICQAVQWVGLQMEPNTMVPVELQLTNGLTLKTNLPASLQQGYTPRLPVPIAGIADSASVSWTRLDKDIGYIYVRRLNDELIPKLDKAVSELKNARGLIIDVRGNSGGWFDADQAFRNFSAGDRIEPERPRYNGSIALLLDSRCISAGEGWGSWFIANRRARTFGETTAGASSGKRTYTLTNGFFTVTFPVKPYNGFLDRKIERRGLEPDVPLRQNACDLAAGRDTVLEAAKKHLINCKPQA